jgi:hypothetical protein
MWTEHDEGTWTAQVQHQPPSSDSRVIGTFSADDVRQDTGLTGPGVDNRGAAAPSARDQPRKARDRQSPRPVRWRSRGVRRNPLEPTRGALHRDPQRRTNRSTPLHPAHTSILTPRAKPSAFSGWEERPPILRHVADTRPKRTAPDLCVSAGQGLFSSGGRYWVRTSDLFGVNEARYHCANRPRSHRSGLARGAVRDFSASPVPVHIPPRTHVTTRPLRRPPADPEGPPRSSAGSSGSGASAATCDSCGRVAGRGTSGPPSRPAPTAPFGPQTFVDDLLARSQPE